MLIQLPAETWMEILNWLRRRDLVKKLDQLWDREFTPIVQDWLHKYTRNVTIYSFSYVKDTATIFPFPEVELPENITGFGQIEIVYFDSTLIAFLRRIRRFLHNLNLNIGGLNLQNIQTVLRHLLPLIEYDHQSIEAITLANHSLLPLLNDANFQTAVFNAILLKVYVFQDLPQQTSQLLVNWLFTGRQDGLPRILLINFISDDHVDGFVTEIRQCFLDPDRQLLSPFFFRFLANKTLEASVTENVRTGEQLTVQTAVNNDYVLITNWSLLNADPDWLAKKTQEVCKWDFFRREPTIALSHYLEIGPLPEIEEANQPQLEADEADQPQLEAEEANQPQLEADEANQPQLEADEANQPAPLVPIENDSQQPSTSSLSEEANIAQENEEKPGTSSSNAQNLEEEEEEPGKKRARLDV